MKKRTDKQRLDWITHIVDVKKFGVLLVPDRWKRLSSKASVGKNVRAAIDKLMAKHGA